MCPQGGRCPRGPGRVSAEAVPAGLGFPPPGRCQHEALTKVAGGDWLLFTTPPPWGRATRGSEGAVAGAALKEQAPAKEPTHDVLFSLLVAGETRKLCLKFIENDFIGTERWEGPWPGSRLAQAPSTVPLCRSILSSGQ